MVQTLRLDRHERQVFLTVCTHVLLVGLVLISLRVLLRSVAHYADHDMDFARGWADNGSLIRIFAAGLFLRSHPLIPVSALAACLVVDWRLCSRLVGSGSEGFVARASFPVAAGLLLALLLILFPVGRYLEGKAERLDALHDYWSEHPARLWVRQNSVPFAVSDLPVEGAVELLNKEMLDSTRITLHLPERARSLRVSYTPNKGEPDVRLEVVLEVLRVQIEAATGLHVTWTAEGKQIDFHCSDATPAVPTQSGRDAPGEATTGAEPRR